MHIKVIFTDIQPEQQEWVIALLAEAGYTGFEEQPETLIAFTREEAFDPGLLKDVAYKYQLNYLLEEVADQNWNELWESNFQPVRVGDAVFIRAPFHSAVNGILHDIIITPKMSFGTGHHATTAMMIRHMMEMDFAGRDVFDFGTGTGVLAILSEKRGARGVLATDSDPWSISNASENVLVNGCERVRVEWNDSVPPVRVDIILANINLHVILGNIASLAGALQPGGQLVISGFLETDEEEILESATGHSLREENRKTDKGWLSIRFSC